MEIMRKGYFILREKKFCDFSLCDLRLTVGVSGGGLLLLCMQYEQLIGAC